MTYSARKKMTESTEKIRLLTCVAIINFDFGILYLRYEFMSRIIELFNAFLLISFPLIAYQVKTYYRPIIKIIVWAIPIILIFNTVFNSGSGIENYRMFFTIQNI